MAAEHAAVEVDDVARRCGFGPQALDQPGIIAVGDEADVLAVGLGGDLQAELGGDPADLVLGQVAEREAQEIELLARRPVEEIALVAARIGALVQLGAAAVDDPADIMAGGEAVGAELAREGDRGRRTSPPGCSSRTAPACGPRAYSSTKRSITPPRKRLS